MLNREFNYTCQNTCHSLFHWTLLMSSGQLTDLDVAQEKRADDRWNVDGNRNLSDSWTGFTRFTLLNETPPKRIYVVRGETDKNPNDITSRSHMAWRLDKNWRSRSNKRKTRMGNRETESRTRQRFERNLFYGSEWRRIQRHHWQCKAKVGDIKGSCNAIEKRVSSTMHTGNHCFKNRKSQSIWSKDQIQLYHWSPSIHKTKSRVSNEKDSWRTRRGKKGRLLYCIQFSA